MLSERSHAVFFLICFYLYDTDAKGKQSWQKTNECLLMARVVGGVNHRYRGISEDNKTIPHLACDAGYTTVCVVKTLRIVHYKR